MIRNAVKEDSKIISSLVIRGWQNAYRGLIDDNFLDNMNEEVIGERWKEMILSQDEKTKVCVYEKNGKILGVIKYGVPEDTVNGKYNAEIQILYVEHGLKGKGIGTKLFKNAKKYFIKNNMNNLIIWCLKGNEKSIKFYEKMGGKIVTERKGIVHEKELEEVGLEYKLK